MTFSNRIGGVRNGWIVIRLCAVLLLLCGAQSVRADNCSDYQDGLLDGAAGTPAPTQLQIDRDCTIRNYSQSNPFDSNINFYSEPNDPTVQRYLVVFDDVYYTGQMSCNDNDNHNHRIWFTNGTIATNLQPQCRTLFIPVEKIDKTIPSGQTTATIGVPFTYRLTMPVLYDPLTGTVINDQGSLDDLHGVTVSDDLNGTGAVLSYVSHVAYWEGSGTPLTAGVDYTFTNVGGLLTFDNFPIIPAGEQIIVELTVVLEDVDENENGTTFINTANWDFGRLIDGVFYEPLPGERGISPPLTIAAPDLVVDKTGPATMSLAETAQFTIDVTNVGLSDAWNVTLVDRLPNGPTGGMCDAPPVISSLTLAGTPLTEDTHYTLGYTSSPANCQLTLTLLDAAGPIAPGQHLVLTYAAELDADTQNGVSLTNVAAATEWFNGDSSIAGRQPYTRNLTNGTVGIDDHEDAHTVTVAITGYFFEKIAANLTTGASPTTTAAAGHTLRYTLRLVSATEIFTNVRIYDELDALNALPAFVPGSLNLVAWPAGADISNTSSTGGANGTGVIDIRNLNVPAQGQIEIQFDVTLAATLPAGTVVTNQSALRLADNSPRAVSDDPNVNGPANPDIAGDEDPTRVVIVPTSLVFEKTVANVTSGADPAAIASPGDRLRYRLRLENQSDFELSGLSVRDEIDRLNADPAFQPGTLTVVTVPPGADASNTSASGGASGTGVLDIRNVTLAPSGGTAVIEFEVTLASVLDNGTDVLNQSELLAAGAAVIAISDDPNINGAADPDVAGDEDPTRIQIVSAAAFRVQKISDDLTGDPAVLLAGETLRYTITVKNIGNANATDAMLRDQIPVNTTYVAGSTTLNGAPVADVGGTSPLVAGMLINAPEDPTPGAMRADASATTTNVATITFDVVVDPDAIDGTIISNQGFVSALDGGVADQPSDDPATPIADDPTRDIVGNLPLLFAAKDVVLFDDQGSPGIVDPGDVLRYTITVQNSGSIAATAVVLRDPVPANTTYVADSTTLNGLPVGQPDGGVAPLAAGIDVSSSDLTPPLPGAGAGTISAGESAVLVFDLRVNDGVPAGTVISNQAVVASEELLDLLTDGDGNPATGPEPTIVVVGSGQQLTITKAVAVVGGGAAVAGATLEYTVTVNNVASVPAQYVVLTDDIAMASPGYLTYVDGSATLAGTANGVVVTGTLITADYAALYGALEPGESTVLRFRAVIDPTLAIGTTVTNTGMVKWNTPEQTASASVSIAVGGTPGAGILEGAAWHDADFDRTRDATERVLEGWSVELYRDGSLVATALTDVAGAYRLSGVAPNYATTVAYELRFRAPGAGVNTALLGLADSEFTNYLQRIAEIVVTSGSVLQNLNLPINPNGVVYDALRRVPLPGIVLTLTEAGGAALPATCFDDPAQQGQVTPADGWYRFDLNFSGPACPSGGSYLIEVSAVNAGYVTGFSEFIPPTSDAGTAPFVVPSCPAGIDDAVPATAQYCESQTSEYAPGPGVGARSAATRYHVHLTLDDSQPPGSSQIFNNHLAIDPVLEDVLTITKTTPMLNVTRGQLVPYVITLTNDAGVPLQDLAIVDRYPAGFSYVEGSARLDGVAVEPELIGRELYWNDLTLDGSGRHELQMLLAVGAGVSEGEFTNRAQAVSTVNGAALSGEATATVRVVPDPTFDCTDVTGKVFDDANRNGLQDPGERGLPGVRLVTTRGLAANTDAHGRFHITCAVTPMEGRGSNFVLKLDDRTLPSGYRLSTDEVRVQRATRGKSLKFNFGASIHRVIGLDVADAVFEPGTTEMRLQWRPRMDLLLEELKKAPAVLRLSYVADIEDPQLVDERMGVMKQEIMKVWEEQGCCYELTIEPEVFWRLGGPPEQPTVRMPSSR